MWSNFNLVKYYTEDRPLECLQPEPEKIQTTIEDWQVLYLIKKISNYMCFLGT